jgi:hypothetical protein
MVTQVQPASGSEHPTRRLAVGETQNVVSYAGHRFVMRRERDQALLGEVVVEQGHTFVVSDHVVNPAVMQCQAEGCEKQQRRELAEDVSTLSQAASGQRTSK